MGYNTTIVIRNDALGQIESDPLFGASLARAISQLSHSRGPVEIPAGQHGNAAQAIETHHADVTTVITVGGNFGKKQAETYGSCHHEDRELQLRLLNAWAQALGCHVAEGLAPPTRSPKSMQGKRNPKPA